MLYAQNAMAPAAPSKLQMIDMDLLIDTEAQQLIQQEIDKLWRNTHYLNRMIQQAKLHFPIIESILQEEQVPLDIKYLAIQESGLRGTAVSSAMAVGYWQMKEASARETGLRIDPLIDERMHLVQSTRAAARYIKRNYQLYGNWAYAVIAYYTGPTGARPFTQEAYYHSRSLLIDKQTHWYLMRFIAHKIALEPLMSEVQQDMLLIATPWHKHEPERDWAAVASRLGTQAELLSQHNPWLKSQQIPSDTQYLILYPIAWQAWQSAAAIYPSREVVAMAHSTASNTPSHLSTTPAQRKIVFINHLPAVVAQPGETPASLAQMGGILLEDFYTFNEMEPGTPLQIDVPYFFRKKRRKTSQLYHITNQDETLWHIAQRYGIRQDLLRRRNRLTAGSQLQAGQVIWLRYKRPKQVPTEFQQ